VYGGNRGEITGQTGDRMVADARGRVGVNEAESKSIRNSIFNNSNLKTHIWRPTSFSLGVTHPYLIPTHQHCQYVTPSCNVIVYHMESIFPLYAVDDDYKPTSQRLLVTLGFEE
jgi:hypothetical protein